MAGENIEWAAPEGTEPRRIGHGAPENLETGFGACRPSLRMSRDKHRGIHSPSRGPGDSLDLQPIFFEKPVEHAPGESAMRAAPLKSKIDEDRDYASSRAPGIGHIVNAHPFEDVIFVEDGDTAPALHQGRTSISTPRGLWWNSTPSRGEAEVTHPL